jgi:hypothetical protein
MASERQETLRRLVEIWNSGDFDRFFDLIGPDAEFSPDPSFPDAGTYRGEELRRWIGEWNETWAGSRLEILDMTDHPHASTMDCRWHLSLPQTHDEIPVDDFTLVVWFAPERPDRPTRSATFFDRERALEEATERTG